MKRQEIDGSTTLCEFELPFYNNANPWNGWVTEDGRFWIEHDGLGVIELELGSEVLDDLIMKTEKVWKDLLVAREVSCSIRWSEAKYLPRYKAASEGATKEQVERLRGEGDVREG